MINEYDLKDFWDLSGPYQVSPPEPLQQQGPMLVGKVHRVKANDVQHGGTHYKKYGNLQPWDVIVAWNLDYLAGTALKYIARWEDKGGIEDLRKAIHFLEKKIEVESAKIPSEPTGRSVEEGKQRGLRGTT